jgi:hypothetical protein
MLGSKWTGGQRPLEEGGTGRANLRVSRSLKRGLKAGKFRLGQSLALQVEKSSKSG